METLLKDGRRVSVRTYEPGDEEALVTFYEGLTPDVLKWALPPYDRRRTESWIANPGNIILVATNENAVVGNLTIFQNPFIRMKGIGELIIYLRGDYRGAGLGTKMMIIGLATAKERGYVKINMSVVKENEDARHVYEKVGFTTEGMRRKAYLGEDGQYHDMVEMGILT